jgi:hypothetical protein
MEYTCNINNSTYYDCPYTFFIYIGKNDDDDNDNNNNNNNNNNNDNDNNNDDDGDDNDSDDNNKNNISARITGYKDINTYLDDIYYNVPYQDLPSRIVKKDAKLI